MTTLETVIAFSGTAVGSVIVGGWLNRKKDSLEVQLKEQVFYKTLIKDMSEESRKEQEEIKSLKEKVEGLTNKLTEVINLSEAKDNIIAQLKNTIARWEADSIKREAIVKKKDQQISKLFKELRAHEKGEK